MDNPRVAEGRPRIRQKSFLDTSLSSLSSISYETQSDIKLTHHTFMVSFSQAIESLLTPELPNPNPSLPTI
jgi:hypothetical protein